MKTSFCTIGLSLAPLFGGGASFSRIEQAPVVGKIGRLLNAVTLAAFLSSGSSDFLIGGSAVSAAGVVGAVPEDTLAILSGDHDRFGLESTATGHDVVLDVDNAVRAYLTGKTVKNQSLLHEGGNGSRGETFGSVAADQAEDAEKGHQVKQVSRKLQAGGLLGRGEVRTLKVKQVSRKLRGLLGRGEACADHTECAVGKCKGHRGQGMECRVKLADCKRYGTHSRKRWGCPDGWTCATDGDLKWGSCTAAPTGGPTSTPSTSPTDAPSTQEPTLTPTEAPTLAPTPAPTKAPVDAVSVTCEFTICNEVNQVWVDGVDVTSTVTPDALIYCNTKKTVSFITTESGVLAIKGMNYDHGCRSGGLAIKCTSPLNTASVWNMNSGGNGRLSWLVAANDSLNGDNGDAWRTPPNDTDGKSWYEPGYSMRGDFGVALSGGTTNADNVIGNGDICGGGENEKYWHFLFNTDL